MRKTGTLRDAGRAAAVLPLALGGLLVLAAGVTVAAFKWDTQLDRLFSVGALGCIALFFGYAIGGGRAGLLRKLIGWAFGLAGVGLLVLSAMPDRILANLARALGLL